jgi:hypothetical protein
MLIETTKAGESRVMSYFEIFSAALCVLCVEIATLTL